MGAVRSVDWAGYSVAPSTEWYVPARVPDAFERLLAVTIERQVRHAYNSLMDAVAHNHSGWLYAAAVPAAPLLARIVREDHGWARSAALEILTDLLCFAVEGQEFTGPAGEVISTRGAIRRAAMDLLPDLRDLRAGAAVPESRLAQNLLDAIEETGPAI